MTVNYMREMEKEIGDDRQKGVRRRLLLHACCAPCTSGCLSVVAPHFDVSLFFYNPNIDTGSEYDKRYEELVRFVKLLKENGEEGMEGVSVFQSGYDHGEWLAKVSGLENEPEGGKRCAVCFRERLDRTFREAVERSFDCVTTTLTLSPRKNAQLINAIGEELSEIYGIHWLPSDFKKKDGFLRSVRLSEKYGLYRQDYCGCEFSREEAVRAGGTGGIKG
ncbi:MAG: epoxyqueuosine reductase QueH [Lachnospiraceae bacterium]|nr:epoxyqueuosine reductase QueH [Lachnospiraceae bacterium]